MCIVRLFPARAFTRTDVTTRAVVPSFVPPIAGIKPLAISDGPEIAGGGVDDGGGDHPEMDGRIAAPGRWGAPKKRGGGLAAHVRGMGWRRLPRATVDIAFLRQYDTVHTVKMGRFHPNAVNTLAAPYMVGMWNPRDDTGYVQPRALSPCLPPLQSRHA